MDTKLASRLLNAADQTKQIIYEREQSKDQKLIYDKHNKRIEKNMQDIRNGVNELEHQLSAQELGGATYTKKDEDTLIDIQKKLYDLEALLRGDQGETRDRGRLFGRQTTSQAAVFAGSDDQNDYNDLEDGQLLELQQRLIQDQDHSLDHLSIAIGRQRELGLQIGQELETHAEIIDDVDRMVDDTGRRLQQAQVKLRYVGRKVKDNKSFCIVISLIIVFFILLALFK